MRAHRALLTLALALALAGCSEREHANPLDPANPDTRGRPAGFVALAENTLVHLAWSATTAPGVVGFEVRHRVAGTADFEALPTLFPPTSTGVLDAGLANGTTYEYQLYHVFADGPGGLPAEDVATPGRARVWVSDLDGARIVRLAADGRHIAQSVTVNGQPNELLSDAAGWLWATDVANGALATLQASGAPAVSVSGFSRPGVIAADPLDGSLWVCDETAGLLRHVNTSGNPATPSSIGPLDEPLGVAIDPADRSVWVCEYGGDRVRRISAAGVQLGSTAVISPTRLAIDSLTRDVWVTSYTSGTVVRLSSSVLPVDTLTGFVGPNGVAVDHRRGHVWIADAGGGALVLLDRAGAELARVNGLPGVRAVAVDLASGEAWATVMAGGRAVRVSPTGTLLAGAGGLATPRGIAVER
jgi:DNA-binding beta-propeller fold protein YncE